MKEIVRAWAQLQTIRHLYGIARVNHTSTKSCNSGSNYVPFTDQYDLSDHTMDLDVELSQYCHTECNRQVIVLPVTGLDGNIIIWCQELISAMASKL